MNTVRALLNSGRRRQRIASYSDDWYRPGKDYKEAPKRAPEDTLVQSWDVASKVGEHNANRIFGGFSLPVLLHVMKTVTKKMRMPTRKCRHCGEPFATNRRGRPQLYCRPSHRVRAREKRREAETKLPSEKQVRLLFADLTRLARQRQRFWMMPSNWELGLLSPYERARAKVRSALEILAPEVFRQPSAPAQIELREFDKTFRQLAMEHHPDRGGATTVMQALNQLRQALLTDIERGRGR